MTVYQAVKTTGMDEFANEELVETIQQVRAYTYADLDANDDLYIPVDPDVTVTEVMHEVTTAFAGGVPSLDIGDAADPDGWIPTASIAETTVGDFVSSKGSGSAYQNGKNYGANGGLIVLAHAASLTAGAGKVYIRGYKSSDNWRRTDADTYVDMENVA